MLLLYNDHLEHFSYLTYSSSETYCSIKQAILLFQVKTLQPLRLGYDVIKPEMFISKGNIWSFGRQARALSD